MAILGKMVNHDSNLGIAAIKGMDHPPHLRHVCFVEDILSDTYEEPSPAIYLLGFQVTSLA
jgi:hypothetical protein